MRVDPITISKRRVQARQAYRAVLSGFVLFALVQLGLAVGLENGLGKVRDPLYGGRLDRVRRRLRAGPVKPWTVLMLGSSRTQYGFRMRISEEKSWSEELGHPVAAFNFGVAGGGPLTELLNWKRLSHDGVRPNLLLVEVLPALLAERIPPRDFGEVFLPTDRLAWRDLPLVKQYAANMRPALRREWLESWPFPWYAHRLSIVKLVRPDLLPPTYRQEGDEGLDEFGGLHFIERPTTPAERIRATQGAIEDYGPRLTDFRLGGRQCEALRELLAVCAKQGTPVALVLTPEGRSFRDLYSPATWQAIEQWLTQLSREYSATLINAREWIDDENDFADSHHLLASGANKFTERLGQEYILPLLRRNTGATRLP